MSTDRNGISIANSETPQWAAGSLSADLQRSDTAVRTVLERARKGLDLSPAERSYVA
jgi:hypothetical protein